MVVGTIVGASIFVQPSEITGQVPSVVGVMVAWVISGVLTLMGALVCAELASSHTRTGGVYVYLSEAFSPAVGFLWGWAMFWVMHSGIIAAIAMVFARYFGFFVPLDDLGIRAVAISVVLLLSAVNYVGVKQGTLVQSWFTAGKLLAIGAIVLIGLAFGSRAHEIAAAAPAVGGESSLGDLGLAVVAGLFAFGGWHMVTYSSEETGDPDRTIPRALVLGTLIVTLCYLALNAVYFYLLPFETVASSTRVAADAADAVFGYGGGAAMSALVMFSTFGALSGIVLAGPRVYYAMSRDGLLFRSFATVHPRFRTPHRAIVLQAVWSSVLVATGTYRTLFTRVVYTEWIFFGMMALGLVLLRRRTNVAPPFGVWGYPWVPLIFAVSAFGIVANQLRSTPQESAIGLGIVLIGLPVYLLRRRTAAKGSAA
jgi:APA family basic amino acid/polyamine antiporter